MTNLEEVSMDETSVSGRGLAHLVALRKIKHLSLARTKLTDARLKTGLVSLRQMTELRTLALIGTLITDKGIV
jgi:hypothetical protein